MTPSSALKAHVADIRAAARPWREAPAEAWMPRVTREQVLAFRGTATCLHHRLPAKLLAKAAWGGLQDSAPRAGLLSLHARVENVVPESWEDPALAQIWFRWADYIVPRDDIGVFTLGCLPRDPERAGVLNHMATELLQLNSSPDGLAGLANVVAMRAAQVTGRFLIRWDASRTAIVPTNVPQIDPESARMELARRYLNWYGPATVGGFAKWAGLGRDDAVTTWRRLEPDLSAVSFAGQARQVLSTDKESLYNAKTLTGIRFLPGSDPYLSVDQGLLFPGLQTHPVFERLRESYDRRLVNSLSGRIVKDGEPIGAWGRVQARLTTVLWRSLSTSRLDAVMAEGESLAGPMGKPMEIRVLGELVWDNPLP